MKRETVTGNKALAGELGVSSKTVQNWKKAGVLRPAILSEFGRTIIYDLDKVRKGWQRHLYPWCLIESGMATQIDFFTYYVIQWAYRSKKAPGIIKAKNVTRETYNYDHRESGRLLQEHTTAFIEWLEHRREYITDRRIFGGENPPGYEYTVKPISKAKLSKRIFSQPKLLFL